MNRSLDGQRDTYVRRLMQYGLGETFSRPESVMDSYLKSLRYGSVVQQVPLVLMRMGYLTRTGRASSTRFTVATPWPLSERRREALVREVVEACNPPRVCPHCGGAL